MGPFNVKLAMSIFDKQIQPIISYGCVNWALPSSSKYIYLDNVPNDITNDHINKNTFLKKECLGQLRFEKMVFGIPAI